MFFLLSKANIILLLPLYLSLFSREAIQYVFYLPAHMLDILNSGPALAFGATGACSTHDICHSIPPFCLPFLQHFSPSLSPPTPFLLSLQAATFLLLPPPPTSLLALFLLLIQVITFSLLFPLPFPPLFLPTYSFPPPNPGSHFPTASFPLHSS